MDVVVADADCLEKLLLRCETNLICVSARITCQGNIFYNDIKKINLTNPVKSFWQAIVNENDFQNAIIPVEGFTFEGPIFHRSILKNWFC